MRSLSTGDGKDYEEDGVDICVLAFSASRYLQLFSLGGMTMAFSVFLAVLFELRVSVFRVKT